AVPLPEGRPVPSGITVRSHGAKSAAEIGVPRLGLSAPAAGVNSSAAITVVVTIDCLGINMAHLAHAVDAPARDGIEVMTGEIGPLARRFGFTAQSDEFSARRLHVARFIPGAALENRRGAIPVPRHAKA